MARPGRVGGAVAVAAAIALGGGACTGTTSSGPKTPANGGYSTSQPPVTITVWHGWSDNREVGAFNQILAGFHRLHPNITVRAVKNVQDQQIINGIRAGGSNAPDVAISFTTDNVGLFCSTGAWVNLSPYLAASHIDPTATFSRATLSYTRYKGEQCALPLLGDAYGLYYNKAMFARAGISGPPRTLSQLQSDATKLTQYNPDGSLRVAGYLPNFSYYENAPQHLTQTFGMKWQTADNKSILATDPATTQLLDWQHGMLQAEGGYTKAQDFATGPASGDENSPQNSFIEGKVAMALGGEWTVAEIEQDDPGLDYGTAPFPVPDSRASDYGGGYLSGTVVGIARTTSHAAAAWELVKYLTTNTQALDTFAGLIKNVPTTFASLQSPDLAKDANFETFVKIAANPNSMTTPASPNGGNYSTMFQTWAEQYEAGKVGDLHSALVGLDRQIDAATAQGRMPGS